MNDAAGNTATTPTWRLFLDRFIAIEDAFFEDSAHPADRRLLALENELREMRDDRAQRRSTLLPEA